MKKILSLIIISIFLTACSGSGSDEPAPPVKKVRASVTLQSRSTDDSNPTQNELINSWWVAFVNGQNRVVKIVDRPADKTGAVDHEDFNVDIDAGVYTIYAFANMSNADPNAGRFGFREGGALPDGIDSRTWANVPKINEWIPMTGKMTVDLRQQASTQFKIEVVRLVAKMQYEIINDTGGDVTLTQVSLQPALTDKVNLFPDYESLGSHPVMNSGANSFQIDKTYNRAISQGNTFIDTFYLLESTAVNHETQHYVVKMNILHDSGRNETLTAQTAELQWINRNDYIILPLKIVDFSLAFDILFYPPIGGYPAVLIETKADEYYAKFGSSGKFVLNPKLTDSTGQVLAPDEYTIDAMIVNDQNGILSVIPSIDPTTYEIIGELAQGDKIGTATIDFKVTATYNNGIETPISYSFARTLYIIRQ